MTRYELVFKGGPLYHFIMIDRESKKTWIKNDFTSGRYVNANAMPTIARSILKARRVGDVESQVRNLEDLRDALANYQREKSWEEYLEYVRFEMAAQGLLFEVMREVGEGGVG